VRRRHMPERGNPSHPIVALMAGRYELVRELSTSGDVRRWEAFDTRLQRPVLLEFLPHELASDSGALDRFWHSARASARSSTAAGERVLDAGTDAETGRAFVVHEWPTEPGPAPRADRGQVDVQVPARVRAPAPVRGRQLTALGAVVVLGLAVLVFRPMLDGWLAWVNEPFGQSAQQFVLGPPPVAVDPAAKSAQPAATSVATPTAPAEPAVRATAAPAVRVTPSPTASTASGVTRRVVNTDGRGVALRGSPGGDRLPGKGYDEGATVQAFESSGEWTRIQGSDGRQGWVLSVTLAP
jgi:hypothetical protein